MSNDSNLPDGIPSWLRMTNENPIAAPAAVPQAPRNNAHPNSPADELKGGQQGKLKSDSDDPHAQSSQRSDAETQLQAPSRANTQPATTDESYANAGQDPSAQPQSHTQQGQPAQPQAHTHPEPSAQFHHPDERSQQQQTQGQFNFNAPPQAPGAIGMARPAQPAQPSENPSSVPHGASNPVNPYTVAPQTPRQAPSGSEIQAPPVPKTGKHHAQMEYDLKPPPALDQSNLVNPVKRAPRRGWRKMLYSVTGGHVNVGDSPQELQQDALMEQIRKPLRGDYRIAVMSLKGGVGKTTTTVTLGGVFASVRHDRVIAIDANPDLGTLAQRVAAPGPATIRDLLAAEDTSRYASIRQYTTQAKSRLEVIGSERDPAVSEAFSESDYRHAIDILQHHYNVILTDCGTGLMHSAMAGVLDLANTLVLVTSPALDGAQSASATLDWLNLHGYEQLAANAVVVVSAAHPGNATIDMEQLLAHFRSRTRAVHVIPFDRHLSEGAIIDLERIGKDTLRSYHELAAIVAEDFDSWHRHAQG
ncbi:MinD/ParA family ATP-binding protein [Corynebacterium auriscanis]|uniref:MinD/ParA family ATP-binding protein n=1 Tax=Corynebacterium auriscanis TaxID=99807 RepID=UPI002AFFF5DC|nr:MinD/ParA family protein [Corynebacterium auriscanis]